MSNEKPDNDAPKPEGEQDSTSESYTFDLTPGQRIRLTIEALPGKGDIEKQGAISTQVTVQINSQVSIQQTAEGETQPQISTSENKGPNPLQQRWEQIRSRFSSWPYSLPQTLFFAGIAIYLLTRLIGLSGYPIYFFTDEAIQTNLASDFLENNFRSREDEFFPTYFQNVTYYNLSVSVYAQVLPTLFLGKSVFVNRAVSVLVGLLAPISIGLILRNHFKIRYWWAGVLIIALIPAWFLHSRTAFETSMFVGIYAAFIYYYLRYRQEDPKHLYAALALGSLAYYTYSPGRFVVVLTGFLLLLSDLRYHWENRPVGLRGLGLLVLFVLPQLRFMQAHPDATFGQLRLLASYWAFDIPLLEKLGLYAQEYVFGMNPGYWFFRNSHDLTRHQMGNLAHILPIMLPFAIVGLIIALRHIRQPIYRVLLITWLVAPSGAALADIGITRALVYVFPASLLITLGLNALLVWLEKRREMGNAVQYAVFALLAVGNFSLLATALTNGPTWESNYGLGGMQYGGRQVYAAVQEYAEQNPDMRIVISPIWANGTDILGNFFIPQDASIAYSLASIDSYLNSYRPEVEEDTLLVMTPEEYDKASNSGKFSDIEVEQTLPYPDGKNGFYFMRVQYVDDIEAILEAERLDRQELVESEVNFQDEAVLVKHSLLDMGNAGLWFDEDEFSVARTLEANPLVMEFFLPQTQEISGITVITGSSLVDVNLLLFEDPEGDPVVINFEGRGDVQDPSVTHDFETTSANFVRLEIRDLTQGEIGNVHLWEVEFK
ncbi:MAG: hypothetical protein DWQ07_13090 [Chloroflexi bacterium]|nr:MAG: hypothetical protein DWQ07_13090 [Chloroflexota bacterium]MBL1196976.1 hypothetical protein [Chloroflexota bacterium]NOH14271.1 hypothetical protein [Chloroflexota bacterium]